MRSIRVCRTVGEWYPGMHKGVVWRSPVPICARLDPAIINAGDGDFLDEVPMLTRRAWASGSIYPVCVSIFGSWYTSGSPSYTENAWGGFPGLHFEDDSLVRGGAPGYRYWTFPGAPTITALAFVPRNTGSETTGWISYDDIKYNKTGADLAINGNWSAFPNLVNYDEPNVLVVGDGSWFQGSYYSGVPSLLSTGLGGFHFLDAHANTLPWDLLEMAVFYPMQNARYDLIGTSKGDLGRMIAEHYRRKWFAW